MQHNDSQVLETIWATCIVLALLETFFGASHNEWTLVEQKAVKLVKRSLVGIGQDAKKFAEVLEDAKKFVKSQKIKM